MISVDDKEHPPLDQKNKSSQDSEVRQTIFNTTCIQREGWEREKEREKEVVAYLILSWQREWGEGDNGSYMPTLCA